MYGRGKNMSDKEKDQKDLNEINQDEASQNETIQNEKQQEEKEEIEQGEVKQEKSKKEEIELIEEIEERSPFSAVKVVLITLAVLFLIVAGAVAGAGYYVYANLQPVDVEEEELVQIEVPMGSSASRIAAILKENNLVRNEQIFYYYVRYKGESGFQAGEYYLSANMELDDIIQQLKSGRIYLDSERFTVAEGLSVDQKAAHLESIGLVNKERFLQLLNEGDFSDISFISEIPESEHRKYRLEGFLFPETYEIYKGASEEEIIRLMLRQFEKELAKVDAELKEANTSLKNELEERGLTLYEAITLASIVEREAVVNDERQTISGVFHNRIKEGWLLQSCATVQFVLGKQRDRLLFSDLEVESPYNTYINSGLPPSPIASPGRQALKAAIQPEVHEYFFFVTKKDGSGSHHFSKTYKEHQQNDAQSRGNF